MALDGTTLYFAGTFTQVGVTARQGIAAINAQTGGLLSWDPGVSGGTVEVRKIIPYDGKVYIFGDFTTAGGASRSMAAALDASTGLATLYMAGAFTDVNSGTTRNHLAAVDASSAIATGWDPDANGDVEALALLGDNAYVGGAFTLMGADPRSKAAAVAKATGLATSWDPNANSTVFSLVATAPTVWLGGGFTTVGGFARNRMAAVNTFDAGLQPFNPSSNGSVLNMQLVAPQTVYAAGLFTTIGGQSRSKFAAVDTVFSTATSWIADSAGGSNNGRCVLSTPYGVFVGGQFTSINAVSKTGIANTVP